MSQVYLLKTSSKTVVRDYAALMRAANYKKFFKKDSPVVIKLNLSWTRFYPGCSTWPWQLEGIIRTLLEDGFEPSQIIPVENRTVVTDVYQGAKNNKWLGVLKKYGIKMRYLTEEKYIKYKPNAKMLVLNKVFPQGLFLPKIIFGTNLIHVPTLKMHVFTVTTGAIKNYFGMLNLDRHYAHRHIHETLVDLLAIQKEVHPGIFSITDGTVAGEGSGPRAMKWHIKNLLLASADQVALDAVSAKIMGFEPDKIKYLQKSSQLGLGNLEPKVYFLTRSSHHPRSPIRLRSGPPWRRDFTPATSAEGTNSSIAEETPGVKSAETPGVEDTESFGDTISKLPNFHFKRADTFASKGQKFIYHSPLIFEKTLLQSPLVPWSYLASNLYHDYYWYHLVGKRRVKEFLKTSWGKLFLAYP